MREANSGSLHEFHVTLSANNESKGCRIVGIHLFGSERGRHGELADSTREVVGFRCWERHDIYLYSRCGDFLAHHLRETSAAKENVEGVHRVILHLDLCFESDAGNRDFACLLRENNILFPDGSAIVPAIDAFVLERHLCASVKFLNMTAVYLRHIAGNLLNVYQRIELVGEHHSLLFVDFLAIGRNGHIEVVAVYLTSCRTTLLLILLARAIALLLIGRLRVLIVGCRQNLHVGSIALDGLSLDYNGCRWHLEGSLLYGNHGIGEGYRTALGCTAIRHRETAGTACAGTVKYIETLETSNLEVFYVLCVGHITDTDSLSHLCL